jgi:hypothetical protein
MLLPIYPPAVDQQQICFAQKTSLLLSNLRNVYGIESGRRYFYLPVNLFIQLPFLIYGIDIRYGYLLFLIVTAFIFFKYSKYSLSILLLSVILFCPEFFLRSLHAENHIVSLFALIAILLLFPLRHNAPLSIAFLIALCLNTRQYLLLLLPFISLYLIVKKEYKFLAALLIFFSSILIPFLLTNFQGFYTGTVWKHTYQVPHKLWNKYHLNFAFNAQGLLTALGFDPEFVWNKIPWFLLQILTYFAFLFFYYKKLSQGDNSLSTLFREASRASVLFLFLARQMRIFLVYYFVLLLPIIGLENKYLEERKINQRSKIFIKYLPLLILILISENFLVGKIYTTRWTNTLQFQEINFTDGINIEKNLTFSPQLALSLKRGFGFLNNEEGTHLALFLPNNEYNIRIITSCKTFIHRQKVKDYLLIIPLSPYLREEIKSIKISPFS